MDGEEIPRDWCESVIVSICVIGDRSSCENHRGISSINIASKRLAEVILWRLSSSRDHWVRENQGGLSSGQGYVVQIFTLQNVSPPICALRDLIGRSSQSIIQPLGFSAHLKACQEVTLLFSLYVQTAGAESAPTVIFHPSLSRELVSVTVLFIHLSISSSPKRLRDEFNNFFASEAFSLLDSCLAYYFQWIFYSFPFIFLFG